MSLPRLRFRKVPVRVTSTDPSWPHALDDLGRPPEALWIAGVMPPLDRAVGIVGTRHADEAGLELARLLAADLGRAGCVIVSGGARGIDAAAHEGALEAKAPTVVVLATGLERAYPKENRALFERAAETGAVCAESDSGYVAHPGRFLERNKIIAALSRILIVVQAPARSGALSTARHAFTLGRPVFAVPGSPLDPRASGCLELLRKGALVCTCAADALSVDVLKMHPLVPAVRVAPGPAPMVLALDEEGMTVWSALSIRPRHPDEICAKTRLPPARVQHALLTLVLGGLAVEKAGAYVRAPSPRWNKGL